MMSDISEGGVGLDFAWKDGVSCSSDPIGGGGMMANTVRTDANISKQHAPETDVFCKHKRDLGKHVHRYAPK